MDDELRRREREARADADPGELRRCARSLERAGRRGDAVEALLPRRDDPEVRRELARLWGEVHLDAGAGAWDTRGPSSTPRPRWTRRLARRVDEVDEPELLVPTLDVGPLGVVVSDVGTGTERGTVALDADTGEVRWSARDGKPLVAGEAVLLGYDRTVARELWTGATLWEVDRVAALWSYPAGLLLELGGSRRVLALRDPRRPFEPTARRVPGRHGFAVPPTLFVAGQGDDAFLIFDVVTGEVVTRGRGQPRFGSSAGLVVDRAEGGFAVLDLDGRERWRSPLGVPLALGDGVVLAWSEAPRHLLALDGATGAPRRLGEELGTLTYFACVARDLAFVLAGKRLAAVRTSDGEVAWTLDPLASGERQPRPLLRPLAGRLYGLLGTEVFCLEAEA